LAGKDLTTVHNGDSEEQQKSKNEKSEQGAGEKKGETSKIRILL
jgi:hypothetical protein